LPTLQAIPFLHGNGLAYKNGLTSTGSMLAYVHRGSSPYGQANVDTAQTSGRTTGQWDGQG